MPTSVGACYVLVVDVANVSCADISTGFDALVVVRALFFFQICYKATSTLCYWRYSFSNLSCSGDASKQQQLAVTFFSLLLML